MGCYLLSWLSIFIAVLCSIFSFKSVSHTQAEMLQLSIWKKIKLPLKKVVLFSTQIHFKMTKIIHLTAGGIHTSPRSVRVRSTYISRSNVGQIERVTVATDGARIPVGVHCACGVVSTQTFADRKCDQLFPPSSRTSALYITLSQVISLLSSHTYISRGVGFTFSFTLVPFITAFLSSHKQAYAPLTEKEGPRSQTCDRLQAEPSPRSGIHS